MGSKGRQGTAGRIEQLACAAPSVGPKAHPAEGSHDPIFSAELDASLRRLGLKVITTPVRGPQANSLCERLIGTLRRECGHRAEDWLNAWDKLARRGKAFLSLSIKAKPETTKTEAEATSAPRNLDDDIPWK